MKLSGANVVRIANWRKWARKQRLAEEATQSRPVLVFNRSVIRQMAQSRTDMLVQQVLAAVVASRMSYGAIARAGGPTEATLRRWERGQSSPRLDTLMMVLKIIGRRLALQTEN